ncbi:response regulator [Henriciella litoralis]|uniref:response regulator n=1 Tax=Henriciella litoralis TaxID=568102 RepID=UPI0009FE927C|nr:response regulator transcription factor [Henriciella litoralis]
MTEIVRVGILEDNFSMRAHFSKIVARSEKLSLAFAAETLLEARQMYQVHPSDICLVDLQLPDGSGMDFVADLQETKKTKALILTVLGDKVSVLAALQAGAQGYLLKDTPPSQIEQAIESVMSGDNPISPQAATHLLTLLKTTAEAEPLLPVATESTITPREKDILVMFSRGLSYQETADVLEIKLNTVREYTKSIYRKLSVHSRNEAIFEALQSGLIDINP